MTPEARLAALFRLDEEGWARHANPWSGWTRFATLPLLVLAGWSRVWIGQWWLLATALLLAWLWVNPRLFAPPRHWDAWITRGVLGERIWLARDTTPVPAHHRVLPLVLTGVALAGFLLMVAGIVVLAPWPTMAGMTIVLLAKLWFVDRMAWLLADSAGTAPPPGQPMR
jgi:hypothetical protein